MEHHIRRKAVPRTPTRSSSPTIAPSQQPASQHTHTSRVSSDSDTSPRQSLISRRSSHDQTDQREPHARNSFVSRRSSDEETVQADARQSFNDYSSLPGDPPLDLELPSPSSHPARRSSLDATPPAKHATRMLDKLGWWPATLVVLCLVLLAISAGFISWIWFARREDARWRNLMLGPNSTVAVTITTFVVRLAIAGITWVMVAMMASVVVERHGVLEGKMAEASIARYTGSILSLALDGFTLKTSWFRILVPLQVVCMVVSQLSSTLLFSDFKNVLLPGFPVETSVKYDFNSSSMEYTGGTPATNPLEAFSREWHRFQPSTFEPFAEHSRPEEKIVGDTVDDTGPVWRAFLPLGAYDNNTNIHEYNGVARVFDARTICVRPDIQTFRVRENNVSTDDGPWYWVGKARIDASRVPDVLYAGGDGVFEEEFACSESGGMYNRETPKWVQCELGTSFLTPGHYSTYHRIPTLDPLFYNRSAIDTLQAEWAADYNGRGEQPQATGWGMDVYGDASPKDRILGSRTGQTQILVELSYGQPDWYSRAAQKTLSNTHKLNVSIGTYMGEGPWNVFDVEGWENNTVIRATYCWDVMSHGNAPVPYLNITATSEAVMSLPVTSWNESTTRYLTEDVRSQLGVTTNTQERAVFNLTWESLEQAIERKIKPADVKPYVIGHNPGDVDPYSYQAYLAKTNLVSLDIYNPNDKPQIFWNNLLTDVVKDTGSPALALQAINTMASRMIYTNWRDSYTVGAQAQVTHFTDFRVPVEVAGYVAVMVAIATQVALLIVVGAMFKSCTNSVLNNAWLVVSQVSSSQGAVGALVREKGVTDADVKRFVGDGKSGGVRRRLVVRDGAFRDPDEV